MLPGLNATLIEPAPLGPVKCICLPSQVFFPWLSENPGAFDLLEANPDKINWSQLSRNQAAIHLLEKNPDRINWVYLSQNPNAMALIEANQDKINWYWLSSNTSIFQYDYDAMRERCSVFKEDLIKDRFHPRNLIAGKFKDWGIDGFDSDSEDE